MMATRLLLADDHTLVRHGLRLILERCDDFEVVAEARSGAEAVELAKIHQPDVAVVDIGMKELDGIQATAQIVRHSPRTAVIILSMHDDERYVVRSVRAGARGYLLKDSVESDLVQAIRQVLKGNSFFSPAVARVFRDRALNVRRPDEIEDRYELLTDRERHIYQLLAEGNSNKEIAYRLGLSLHTVETHRTHIMEKLELHGIAELVLSAVRRGIVM